MVDLTFGVAVGPDLATPPAGDPESNATGEDWLAVWRAPARVTPRSNNAAINGYDLRFSLGPSVYRACPRAAYGTGTSIWLVSSALQPVQAGTLEWASSMTFEYQSFIP
jgi:hypothetical protein